MKHRRGASLIEMMVVMAVMTAVLSTVGVLFHRLFQSERLSTQLTLVELATMRLADQFRRDVHAAQSVSRTTKGEDSRPVLELQSASSKVVYTVGPQRVQREVVGSAGTTARELYRLPECEVRFPEPESSADMTPEFVSLVMARPHATMTAVPQAKPTRREIVVDAELGRDLRLAGGSSIAAKTERNDP